MELTSGKLGAIGKLAVVLIVLAAAFLRLLDWPARYEVRNVDEAGYLYCSLALVEGITPGYKPSPAGPQIWIGWVYAEIKTACRLIHPDPSQPKVPLQLRPFMAMNQALFSLYHDLSGMRQIIVMANVILLLIAVMAGFYYGWLSSGVVGGVLVGGLLGVSPLFLDFSLMSRPYSMAWSLTVLSVCAAAAMRGRYRTIIAGILLGLAIGSRIEMVLMIPLLLWELSDRRPGEKALLKVWFQLILISLFTAYVVAPWLLTGLPGNLRAIGTIQIANPRAAAVSMGSILSNFAWTNGFGPAALLFILGIPFILAGPNRFRSVVLVVVVLLLLASILKTTGFGLHQSGAAVLIIVLSCARPVRAIQQRWPRYIWVLVPLILLIPLVQSVRTIAANSRGRVTSSADWVTDHVPAGTVVYMQSSLMKVPLPTTHAADFLWDDVTNDQAWRRKFASGLARFGLNADQLPRAMSEENLVQERGNMRRWFILGSQSNEPEPRYELRLIQASPIFGVQDVAKEFAATGGVVLWPDSDPPPELGKPLTVLHGVDGGDVLVFCSSELRSIVGRP